MVGVEEILLSKINSAREALKHVKDGQVIGVGAGTTTQEFIRLLAEKVRREKLKITAVPASIQTRLLLQKYGIPVSDPNTHPHVDIAVDGADQVESKTWTLIKGGGGCHTLEKVIDYNAKKLIIIVDYTKLAQKLNKPVPVEVIPHAITTVKNWLIRLGAKKIELRISRTKYGPTITENGNIILDAYFPKIADPIKLEEEINNIPGVLENGLFARRKPDIFIVGYPDKAREIKCK